MNETEEAVRRLFAAASEDIPAGIDLVRGVRARRRGHVVRVRALVATGTAAIAAAAAITLSVSQAPSALAQVTQAASRTAAQSYRVSVVVITRSASGSSSTPVTISGEFDPARGVGEETTSQGWQIRYVSGYVYLPVTDAIRGVWDATQPAPLPDSKSWLRAPAPRLSVDTSAQLGLLSAGAVGFPQFSPQDLLALLESASQVREVGPASGPGWTGTAYTFTSSATLGGPLRLVVRTLGTVDVDQQGRVRELNATQPLGNTVHKTEMTFGDFGAAVSVSAPPASQTASMPR